MNVEVEKINDAKALKLHAWHFFIKKRGKNLQAITKTVVVVEVAKNSQKSTIVCGIG